ncbi:MAG: PP2C family serine/threonine-protein phosphatase [bacterium]|nr:PP2C family serine/threonine-protein phosphatase [bacterium]
MAVFFGRSYHSAKTAVFNTGGKLSVHPAPAVSLPTIHAPYRTAPPQSMPHHQPDVCHHHHTMIIMACDGIHRVLEVLEKIDTGESYAALQRIKEAVEKFDHALKTG